MPRSLRVMNLKRSGRFLLGYRAFAAGQVYVALSRARSLKDIRLSRPIREEEVRCEPDVVKFYGQMSEMTGVS